MPYSVGEKGSYGCSGYPVIKDGSNEIMGCHETKSQAAAQVVAINLNEAEKASVLRKPKKTKTRSSRSPGSGAGAVVSSSGGMSTKSEEAPEMEKRAIDEGDYVMGMTVEGIAHGKVEHVMWEGGTLGEPGTMYSLESMPPSNPAMSVRVYEQAEEGYWVPTAYSIGMMYVDATKLDSLDNHTMPEEMQDYMVDISKAETYSPNDGMKAAARTAIRWKEEGKAKGAGTPVGWGRARDIVAGRSMSLSVVKRMYSFFSRHEVDKKGKGFNPGTEGYPSKGRVMWNAWGGDAGFAWSRAIVNREANKALFNNFGKDFTRSESLTEIFKSLSVGSMVAWSSSGGTARGKITRIIRDGRYKVPGTDVVVTGTPEDPAAVIRLYRDGEPTDTIVAHKIKTLRVA
jgi:hypothetical protein